MNKKHIAYEDGDTDFIDMSDNLWCFRKSSALVYDTQAVISDQPAVIKDMFYHFGNKQFLRHKC